jgi:hypothetical protein
MFEKACWRSSLIAKNSKSGIEGVISIQLSNPAERARCHPQRGMAITATMATISQRQFAEQADRRQRPPASVSQADCVE